MFTLKLFADHANSVHLVEADNFSVHWNEGKHGATITAHFSKMDKRYFIGDILRDVSAADYDWAVIENSNGKTTERLVPTIRAKVA